MAGLLVGAVFYGRGFRGAKIGTGGAEAEASWLRDRPAFVACVVACSLVVAVAAAAWRRTGIRPGVGDGCVGSGGCGGVGVGAGAAAAATRLREVLFFWRRGREEGGWRPRGRDDEAPLLADMSVHDPELAASGVQGSADLEAGADGSGAAGGPVSARWVVAGGVFCFVLFMGVMHLGL